MEKERKGNSITREMQQTAKEEDDDEKVFHPSKWVRRLPESQVLQEHIRLVNQESDVVKNTISCDLGVAFGNSEKEKLDLFGFKVLPQDCKIFVYIHGGYWQEPSLKRENSSYCVKPLVNSGIAVVIIGYDLAPKVTVENICTQIERGIKYVANLAESRGSKGVYIAGHSAGAHLAISLLNSELFSTSYSKIIKGFVLISGVFDLRRLISTTVNDALGLDEDGAKKNSPLMWASAFSNEKLRNMKILILVGMFDSPEFMKQSEEFFNLIYQRGCNAILSVIEDADHFNIVEQLAEGNSRVTQAVLKFVLND